MKFEQHPATNMDSFIFLGAVFNEGDESLFALGPGVNEARPPVDSGQGIDPEDYERAVQAAWLVRRARPTPFIH